MDPLRKRFFLAKFAVLELFSRFFEGHLMGDLRSSCAGQAYRAVGSAAPRVPCSQADRSWLLEQVDLGLLEQVDLGFLLI